VDRSRTTNNLAQKGEKFCVKNIICQYGMPLTIIIYNDRQLIDRGFLKFYEGLDLVLLCELILRLHNLKVSPCL